MIFEWDVKKAEINFEKHAVRFSETLAVFEDEYAITIEDNESDPGEQRFLSIGTGGLARVLVVVYCFRESVYGLYRGACQRPGSENNTRKSDEKGI